MGANAADVPSLLAYRKEVGADGILFQPMEIRSGDWGGNEHLFKYEQGEMDRAIDLLIESATNRTGVLNSPGHLRLFKRYFQNPDGEYEGRQQCTVGDTGMMIHPDGSMCFCGEIGMIGKATETPPSAAWRSKEAQVSRNSIAACTKGCLQTCYAQRTLRDKVKAFLFLVRGSRADGDEAAA
jgi:hypothetical protein